MAITNNVARVDDYLFTHAHHHAPLCNRLKCSTMVTKPPCMSAVVQSGGKMNLNNFSFSLCPSEPLSAVVKTCNIARLQLHNSTTQNPLPAAAPWQNLFFTVYGQDTVLLIQLSMKVSYCACSCVPVMKYCLYPQFSLPSIVHHSSFFKNK